MKKQLIIGLALFFSALAFWHIEQAPNSTGPTVTTTAANPTIAQPQQLPPTPSQTNRHQPERSAQSPSSRPSRSHITHLATTDGPWSAPSTWEHGERPNTGANVLIPAGVHVELDAISNAHLASLQIDGALTFVTNANTKLLAETITVGPDGQLVIGTEATPVDADVEALVALAPLPGHNDAVAQLNSFGILTMHGHAKTTTAILDVPPRAGDHTLSLDAAPEQWQVGDQIAIGGSRFGREGEPIYEVTAVDGRHVHITHPDQGDDWNGLAEDYETHHNLRNFVINLSRNVAIAGPDGNEAAVVTIHESGVSNTAMAYVGAYGLGTTEGDGPARDEDHRPAVELLGNGSDLPAQLAGLALVNVPTPSIAANASQITIVDSIAYDAEGSAWLTDTGAASRLYWTTQRQLPVLNAVLSPQSSAP